MLRVMDTDTYVRYIRNFADKVGRKDVARCMYWGAGKDKYIGTKMGLVRWKCALSLEYFVRNILRPDSDQWSECHTAICKELEKTNIITAIHGCDLLGLSDYIPKECRKYIKKIDKLRMFLLFRGWFKTSIISVSHSIQEAILNPNERTAIFSGTLDNAKDILSQMKSHFIYNERFRKIFPEMCPNPGKTGKIELGTTEEFTLPNRTIHSVREHSYTACSPISKLAGKHFIKMKLDDLIDEKNCTNEDQIKNIKRMFEYLLNLFDKPSDPFYSIIGTRYHSDDLHGWLYEKYMNKNKIKYKTFVPKSKKIEDREYSLI